MAGFGWDVSYSGDGVVLSEDQTATRPTDGGGGASAGVRGAAGRSKGRRYFEIECDDSCAVGLVDINADFDSILGNGSNPLQWGFLLESGYLFYNDTSGSGSYDKGTGAVATSVIGILVDFEAHSATFYSNGNELFTQALAFESGVFLFPAVSLQVGGSATLQGMEPFSYPPETSYAEWDKSDLAIGSKVAGVLNIEGVPAARLLKAFSFERFPHSISGKALFESLSLGQTISDGSDGAYEIILRDGFAGEVFVVAFDDYGGEFVGGDSVNAGKRIHPTTPNGYVYECTGSGSLPETEPDPWPIDTETSTPIGTASFEVFPFYRPQVHGPLKPEQVEVDIKLQCYQAVVSLGYRGALSIHIDGTVYGWGNNSGGKLNIPGGLAGVEKVSCGEDHSAVVLGDGTIASWGSNTYGERNLSGFTDVAQVACGEDFTVVLLNSGVVHTVGRNDYGQQLVAPLTGIVGITAGENHWLALAGDGTVSAFGNNTSGQCNVPGDLTGVSSIAAGQTHSYAVKADGTAVSWGDNGNGQRNTPGSVSDWVQMACGRLHTVGLRANGTCQRWGYSGEGIGSMPSMTDIVQITAYDFNAMALKNNGAVYAWGRGIDGQNSVPSGLVVLQPQANTVL